MHVAIRQTRRKKELREAALVLQAMGIPFEVVQDATGFLLVVATEDEARAAEQLARYEHENLNFPPRSVELSLVTNGIGGALVYGCVLIAFFSLDKTGAFGLDWWGRGMSRSAEVLDGEVWRSGTSLLLHADLEHLVSNIIFGGLFGALIAQLVGSGLAWLVIALSGFCGNLMNSWIQGPGHNSIGASTAVFGALGLMVGYEILRRRKVGQSFVRRWAPPLFGAFLLAWLGFGGENTDVLAHVFGFIAGVGLGLPLAWLDLRHRLDRPAVQVGATALLILGIGVAWLLALGAG